MDNESFKGAGSEPFHAFGFLLVLDHRAVPLPQHGIILAAMPSSAHKAATVLFGTLEAGAGAAANVHAFWKKECWC